MLDDGHRFESAGATAADSGGISVTPNNSANTKGGYGELIAATTFDACGFFLNYVNPAAHKYLVDIAIRAAGAEQVVLANFHIGTVASMPGTVWFPLSVPAGTRLAARAQCSSAGSLALEMAANLVGSGFQGGPRFRVVDTYGATTADSGGTSVDPGGAANTKGAYSQLTASTTRALRALAVVLGADSNQTLTTAGYLLDIAIGAAGVEQVVIPDLWFNATTGGRTFLAGAMGPFPCSIPAGTRIAARGASSTTDATDRLFDVVIYGYS